MWYCLFFRIWKLKKKNNNTGILSMEKNNQKLIFVRNIEYTLSGTLSKKKRYYFILYSNIIWRLTCLFYKRDKCLDGLHAWKTFYKHLFLKRALNHKELLIYVTNKAIRTECMLYHNQIQCLQTSYL